jgi:diketogulonate reductase-like aldo/keto reductase
MTTITVGNNAMPAVGLGIWKIEREAMALASGK